MCNAMIKPIDIVFVASCQPESTSECLNIAAQSQHDKRVTEFYSCTSLNNAMEELIASLWENVIDTLPPRLSEPMKNFLLRDSKNPTWRKTL